MDEQKIPIHKRTWFVVVVLIFCFPIGLVLLWKNDRYTVKNKVISTVFFFTVLFLRAAVGSYSGHEDEIQMTSSDEIKETSEAKKEDGKKDTMDDTAQTDNWRVTESGEVMWVNGLDEEEIAKKEEATNVKNAILNLEGKTLQKAYLKLKKYGYDVNYIDEKDNLSHENVKDENDEWRKIHTVTAVDDLDEDNETVTIRYDLTGLIEARAYYEQENDQLTETLHPVKAWRALKNYGETQCPYGFKLHSQTGVINQQALDGEWNLKAYVTITNAFGAKYKTVCEGRVSGTTDNPVVEYFFVYPP